MSERPLVDPLSDSLVGFMEQQRNEARKRQIAIKIDRHIPIKVTAILNTVKCCVNLLYIAIKSKVKS